MYSIIKATALPKKYISYVCNLDGGLKEVRDKAAIVISVTYTTKQNI